MKIEIFFYIGFFILAFITIIYFLSEYIVFLPRMFKVLISFFISFIILLTASIIQKKEEAIVK